MAEKKGTTKWDAEFDVIVVGFGGAGACAALEAAQRGASVLVQDLPRLWAAANLEERRKLLLTMLDAVYVDAKEEKRIVAVKPKAPFRPVFQVATTREGSGVILPNEPPEDSPEARSCFWWRRGRVELPVQRNLLKTCYRLS